MNIRSGQITQLFQSEIPGEASSSKIEAVMEQKTQPHTVACTATYIYGAARHLVPPSMDCKNNQICCFHMRVSEPTANGVALTLQQG